jgi:hypothetical protein
MLQENDNTASFNTDNNIANEANDDKLSGRETLFSVDSLEEKTADNMAKAEARTDEVPLRTEKTEELEEREKTEENNS